MQRIKNNSRVRRRLFPAEGLTDEARIDNFTNILQESIAREKAEMTQKWNFDFENEVPLDGTYQWFPSDSTTDWIGVELQTDCKENEEESFLLKKYENEVTPSTKEGDTVSLLRQKRKSTTLIKDKSVRRKISFE